ncbi:hypothetical protein EYF80_011689 [Liparis tanakae]|uniref:Uncharacterized protein n=1 Tax=Liparis tanakae TaxID=230148 RepID=A0A4Z2IL30_9TELE|nr:hypothetical protein EYF80_011689 [Liparis tanakae]
MVLEESPSKGPDTGEDKVDLIKFSGRVGRSVVLCQQAVQQGTQPYLLGYEIGYHVPSVDIDGADGHNFLSVSWTQISEQHVDEYSASAFSHTDSLCCKVSRFSRKPGRLVTSSTLLLCTTSVIRFCAGKVSVNSLEALGIVGQLAADVVAVGEEAVEVGPGPLDRHPGRDDQVSHHQLPLPAAHLGLEILNVLTHQDVLQLHLKREKREELRMMISEFCSSLTALREVNKFFTVDSRPKSSAVDWRGLKCCSLLICRSRMAMRCPMMSTRPA